MTITKKLLNTLISDCEIIIKGYNIESDRYPFVKHYNDKQVLKQEGKIEAYNSFLNRYNRSR